MIIPGDTKPGGAKPGPAGLAILLLSGCHERAHYAWVVAAGAAALGRDVLVFATSRGCQALLTDWSGLDDAGRDAQVRARGVAGFEELRSACVAFGVRLLACEAGLRGESIDPAGLLPGVEVAGVATFLEASRDAQLLTL